LINHKEVTLFEYSLKMLLFSFFTDEEENGEVEGEGDEYGDCQFIKIQVVQDFH